MKLAGFSGRVYSADRFTRFTRRFAPYLYLLPGLLIVCLVCVFPLLWTLGMSMFSPTLEDEHNFSFTGLKNFLSLFNDDIFWVSLRNTFVWTIGTTILQVFVGLIIALALNQDIYGRNLFRGLLLIPWIIPLALAGVMFQWILNPYAGLVNDLLLKLHIIQQPVAWLAQSDTALLTLILVYAWKSFPFYVVVLLAGLQSIPHEIIESSAIDGATVFQRFRYVILPLIKPVLRVSCILGGIWAFNSMDLIFVMTKGGPANQTQILATYAYTQAFRALNIGYASSMAVVIMMLLAGMVGFYLHNLGKKEGEI